jgi:hypothetical protein
LSVPDESYSRNYKFDILFFIYLKPRGSQIITDERFYKVVGGRIFKSGVEL